MALELTDKIVGAVVSFVVGGGVSWFVATLRIGKKFEDHRKGLVSVIETVETRSVAHVSTAERKLAEELSRIASELHRDLARLEVDLKEIEARVFEERVQSGSNLTQSAHLAQSLSEVREQSLKMNDTLQRVLGILLNKGVQGL